MLRQLACMMSLALIMTGGAVAQERANDDESVTLYRVFVGDQPTRR